MLVCYAIKFFPWFQKKIWPTDPTDCSTESNHRLFFGLTQSNGLTSRFLLLKYPENNLRLSSGVETILVNQTKSTYIKKTTNIIGIRRLRWFLKFSTICILYVVGFFRIWFATKAKGRLGIRRRRWFFKSSVKNPAYRKKKVGKILVTRQY